MASELSLKKWAKTKEVREIHSLSEKKLRQLMRQGILHPSKIGNSYLWSLKEIEEYIASNIVNPEPQKIYVDRFFPVIDKEVGQKEAIDESPNSKGGANKMPTWKQSFYEDGTPKDGHYWLNLCDLTLKEIQGKRGVRFEVDFRQGDSRPTRSLSRLCGQPIDSREEALGALALVRHKLYEEVKEPHKPNGDVTFTQFVPLYLAEKRADRERSFKGLESAVLNRLEPYFGKMLLKDITLETVKRYRDHRRRQNVKDISIWNNELNHLKELYNLAVDNGHKLGTNPVNRRKLKLHIDDRIRYMLPEEERIIWPLLEKHDPLEDLADLIYNTAMRPANECDLQWTWIRWDEKVAIVPKEFHKQKNEGRYLLNDKMIEMLRRRQKEAGDYLYVFWRTESGSNKRHKITTRWIQHKWTKVMAEAGIEGLHFYDLKHTLLSRLAALGATLSWLKAVSNHASTASLERYVKMHAQKESALDLLNRMNGVAAKSE